MGTPLGPGMGIGVEPMLEEFDVPWEERTIRSINRSIGGIEDPIPIRRHAGSK